MATLSEAELQQARIDLAASFRWAVRHGFNEGICNHFSLAVGDDQFLINAHGYHWSEITASSIMLDGLKFFSLTWRLMCGLISDRRCMVSSS